MAAQLAVGGLQKWRHGLQPQPMRRNTIVSGLGTKVPEMKKAGKPAFYWEITGLVSPMIRLRHQTVYAFPAAG
jgi:hypothetical protein